MTFDLTKAAARSGHTEFPHFATVKRNLDAGTRAAASGEVIDYKFVNH